MNEYDKTIYEIRNFNRFYTVNMGFLNSGYLDTSYSVAETRILFELNLHERCIQNDIVKILQIDKSYLSRIIKRFDKNGLIEKKKSEEDKRASYITLTEKGKKETEKLIVLTNEQIRTKIDTLTPAECKQLCNSMNNIISILGKEELI
ncbi:MAG: MarR family winged helix-turn-helix transcriptional regulator [Lachnospiraceae bacterium]|nr:MarR family winged helix-turn-helix transcriptional regulator [Lachnospiraceae bacterium]